MADVVDLTPKSSNSMDISVDIDGEVEEIKALLVITYAKDGVATISHTGLTLAELAVGAKMLDHEFNKMYSAEYVS